MQYLPLVTTLISACINHQPEHAGNCSVSDGVHKYQVHKQWNDDSRHEAEPWFEDHALYKIQQIKQLKKTQ